MYTTETDDTILDVCMATLYKKDFLLTKRDLLNSIKEALKNIYRKRNKIEFNLDAKECFDIMKESGIIGKVQNNRYLKTVLSIALSDRI